VTSIFARRAGRRTFFVLVTLLALLALGAQSGAAGPAEGKGGGKGSGPNGKAAGQAKPAAETSSSTSGGVSVAAAAGGDVFVMTVTPEEVAAFVGTSVVVTAHLTDGGGAPIAGDPVHIRVSGVNSGSANGNTDAGGNVTYTATSAVPGTDVVSACLHRDESSKGNPEDDPDSDEAKKYCDTATIHWVTSPTDVGVVLSGPATAGAGANVTYTATVTNHGPGIAGGVALTYTVPAGLSTVSASATQGGCSGSATIVCEIGTLDAGETATVTLVVNVAAAGAYTSTVSVSADQTDPNAANNTSSVGTGVKAPDVAVTLSASPSSTNVGHTITLKAVVKNNGPGTAAGVELSYDVPSGLEVLSVATTQGTCTGTQEIRCELGTLDAASTATVTILVKATKEGSFLNVVDVRGDGGNGGSNMSTVTTSAGYPQAPLPLIEPPPPPGPFTPPAVGPVQGKTVEIEPVSGTVLVRLTGKKKFLPLNRVKRIPVGSVVDASGGVVKLTSAVNTKGKLQAAVFYEGTFVVKQKKRALTELVLSGGDFSDCDEPEPARTTQGHKKKPRQTLWGNGTGQFQTSGQFSSATVRGTKWYVVDTCDGTLTVVKRGVVKVFDFTLDRIIVLRAGQRHWAKAPEE